MLFEFYRISFHWKRFKNNSQITKSSLCVFSMAYHVLIPPYNMKAMGTAVHIVVH